MTANIAAIKNLPNHDIRDIFLCMVRRRGLLRLTHVFEKANNGPTRCDVTGTQLIVFNPTGKAWSTVTWVSVDGLVSFRVASAFSNLALTATKTRYSTAYAAPGYAVELCFFIFEADKRQVIGNTVYLRGLVKLGAAITSSNQAIATLPAAARPKNRHVFLVVCGSAICRIDITTTGVITMLTTGTFPFVSLAGISFSAPATALSYPSY